VCTCVCCTERKRDIVFAARERGCVCVCVCVCIVKKGRERQWCVCVCCTERKRDCLRPERETERGDEQLLADMFVAGVK
jgi:hypothetical protein